MAILNLEYYTQKDLYSDGDIEEQMLKMAKEGVTCEELSSEQVSFPVIYHFSDLRANILNWYPIKKSDSVLEIGAGCGAITGTLCEKAGQVTSVELSKRRAQPACRQARPEKFRLPGRFVAAFLSDRKGQCRRYNFSENRPSSTGRSALPAGSQ